MPAMTFCWDENKATANVKKHGITFEEAKGVFYDEDARLITDPDHSAEEDCFIIIGLSGSARVLVVAHCYRQEDSIIRIISARKAVKIEEKQYWSNKL